VPLVFNDHLLVICFFRLEKRSSVIQLKDGLGNRFI
jgi:hypothetical protein